MRDDGSERYEYAEATEDQYGIQKAAEELCQAMNRAERAGRRPAVEINWVNGMNQRFQVTRVWKAKVAV